MPRKSSLRCYFGCNVDGPLHNFPTDRYPHEERFNAWKDVLNPLMQERGNKYLRENVRLCYRHFQKCYQLPSNRLTANAIPTLQLQFGVDESLNHQHVDNYALLPPTSDIHSASTSRQIPSSPSSKPKSIIQTKVSKKLHKNQINTLKQRILKLRIKCKTQATRIRMAERLSKSKGILQLVEKLPEPAKVFTYLQFKHLKNKPRGRKYTFEEKILCLTILKQGPKCYNFLKNIFVLPSKRTLQKLLAHIIMRPGISPHIINNLKKSVPKLPKEKRLCSLIFDEVSLAPGLYFNKKYNEINGFEDLGYKKTKKIADHALVLMIKSLKGKFKQPLGFTFCQGTTKKEDLKNILKDAIKAVNATGLKIVCTVCDQSTTNTATIKNLMVETKQDFERRGKEYRSCAFEVDGCKIFPLFDPPHLLKGVRNNLLAKNLRYIENGKVKIAKWQHILLFMEKNIETDELRIVNKLTESHVDKEKIPKMKVKYAAQVFSQQLAAAMKFCTRHGILPQECNDTADFVIKMDQLFDSFNSHSYNEKQKKFRVCLKNNSPHLNLWNELLPVLRSCGFEKIKNDGTRTYEKVPSINNFIHNIVVYKEFWKYLNTKYKVTSLLTRNINQDPLENFFSKIRNNGARNINPTCDNFVNAYKTLVINNFATPHSVNANCEDDKNQLLQTMEFFKTRTESTLSENDKTCDRVEIDILSRELWKLDSNNDSVISSETKSYVAGAIIKKVKKRIFKNCSVCTKSIINENKITSSYIYERDYSKRSLIYPTDDFKILIKDLIYIIVKCIQGSPESRYLIESILFYVEMFCNFNSISSCNAHGPLIKKEIVQITINIILHSWCTGVNRILKGKLAYLSESDKIKADAYKYYKTHCKYKKKM